MEEKYQPPFNITEDVLSLVSDIMEILGELKVVSNLEKMPRLRKVNRLKSIHSSLAIENNTLSLSQVTDVIDGKRVLAPYEDILAVKNASSAYKIMNKVDPYSIKDLLKVHFVMMNGLVSEAGQLRTNQVGVFNEKGEVVHLAPSHTFVPTLIENLFDWVKESKTHMLIKSSVFHYEFEFIHPFRDGNGRMGRLWQTILLSSWKEIFQFVPIENIIMKNQEEYYRAITLSTSEGKSNKFILFMLKAIKSALEEIMAQTQTEKKYLPKEVENLLSVMEDYPESSETLMQKLGLKSREGFRRNYLNPALKLGVIKRTSDKLTSKNQKYIKV